MASAFEQDDAKAELLGYCGEERTCEASSDDSDVKLLAQSASGAALPHELQVMGKVSD